MLPRNPYRALAAVVALAIWAPATAFFATVGLLVARESIVGRAGPTAPIVDARSALITAGYSLCGALVGLGIAWLVLSPPRGRALRWSAALWLGATILLLGTRRVGGWPLLVAALIAVGIGVDVTRRLFRTLIAAWRAEQQHGL